MSGICGCTGACLRPGGKCSAFPNGRQPDIQDSALVQEVRRHEELKAKHGLKPRWEQNFPPAPQVQEGSDE